MHEKAGDTAQNQAGRRAQDQDHIHLLQFAHVKAHGQLPPGGKPGIFCSSRAFMNNPGKGLIFLTIGEFLPNF